MYIENFKKQSSITSKKSDTLHLKREAVDFRGQYILKIVLCVLL
jgi:hypothetical protein